jgi:hypothetical protein
MKERLHSVFVLFLILVGALAVISLSVRGWNYYLTPISERPFREDYTEMKPSGSYSHSLGIFGSLMIVIGVSTYSTRKRVRALWNLGKISRWLQFHIFLCLLGPILIVYHSTFKAGGIAAISLWCMLTVAASGIIGRFLYSWIPKNLSGNQLTLQGINAELHKLASSLMSTDIGMSVTTLIDETFESVKKPETLSETLLTLFRLQYIKTTIKQKVHTLIQQSNLSKAAGKQIEQSASELASLFQKSYILTQVEKIFYYWHVIHLPFTIIMFVSLALHVTVAILLGYTWIF